MGFACALAAAAAGADVTLITGPVSLLDPPGVTVKRVTTAEEMYAAVQGVIMDMEVAIFAAAVADYRPTAAASQKIKKSEGTATLELERTPDILGSVRQPWGWTGYLLGFAAETENLLAYARTKLVKKGCDVIAANDVGGASGGFDSPDNEVTLIFKDGSEQAMPLMPKSEIATALITLCLSEALARRV